MGSLDPRLCRVRQALGAAIPQLAAISSGESDLLTQ